MVRVYVLCVCKVSSFFFLCLFHDLHKQGLRSFIYLWVPIALVAAVAIAAPVYDVVECGAIGDGITDDKKVFLDVWNKACADPCSPTMLIPSGKTFLLSPLKFHGPCTSPIHLQIDGSIMAPSKMWLDEINEFIHWIEFKQVIGLAVDGKGVINGNGEPWWQYKKEHGCSRRPDGFGVLYSSNITISNLRFIDSPKQHISINHTDNVHISNLIITAPGTSPNTDGIHVEASRHVLIRDLIIRTGDDCISIGNGTFDLNITRIVCGPGHGISVGSLGRDNTEAIVGQIRVSDCSLYNTTNGVRIKTWQGRNSGYAKGITFERINFVLVERPIIIDQYYCDKLCHHCPNEKSDLQVSKISYSGLSGTAVGPVAIKLNCTRTIGCLNIRMKDVDIRSANGGTLKALCVNAQGDMDDRVSPPVRCMNSW